MDQDNEPIAMEASCRRYEGAEKAANLCAVCHRSLDLILECKEVRTAEKSMIWVDHHSTLRALKKSSKDGCNLCSLLYTTPKVSDNFSKLQCASPLAFRVVYADVYTGSTSRPDILQLYYNFRRYEARGPRSIFSRLVTEQHRGPETRLLGLPIHERVPLGLAANWLADCSRLHPKCRSHLGQQPPPRLLDLGRNPTSQIRLLNTEQAKNYRYAALSHCWGSDPSLLVTTKANLESMLRVIQFQDLAQNFKDAIEVTRALNLRYLWIDSLCITQDDADDWQMQCTLMGDIYANSTVTVIATSASGPHEGFLHDRVKSTWPSTMVSKAIGDETALIKFSRSPDLAPDSHSPKCSTEAETTKGPFTRAWCFQERLLPARVLSFASDRMYLECLTCEYHERLRDPVTFEYHSTTSMADRMNFHMPKDPASVRSPTKYMYINGNEMFYDLVGRYSDRGLTRTSDRLAALSGIARQHHRLTGDEYLAGLWRSDIITRLCWHGDNPSKVSPGITRDLSDPVAPSWSWATCPGRVTFIGDPLEQPTLLAALVSAHVSPVGQDAFGQVNRGQLVIKGCAKTCSLQKHENDSSIFTLHTTDQSGEQFGFVGRIILDKTTEYDKLTILALMAELDSEDEPEGVFTLWGGLALAEVENEPGIYRRVGLFIDALGSYWQNTKRSPSTRQALALFKSEPHQTLTIV